MSDGFDLHVGAPGNRSKEDYLAVCIAVLLGYFGDNPQREQEIKAMGMKPELVQSIINLLYKELG